MAGGTYFFTVNLLQRYPNDLLVRPIELLRTVVRDVRATWPFHIDAGVVCYRIICIVCGHYPLMTMILRTAGG